jgi:polyhydroxybutyrate depolymerase
MDGDGRLGRARRQGARARELRSDEAHAGRVRRPRPHAECVRRDVIDEVDREVRRRGFIAIYPESAVSPTAWNSGTCCEPANTTNIDDTGFMRKLLDEAEAKLCVDTSRVYMMGMSNGGYESHRIGCEMADRFAAIGPVAGLLLFQGCAPTKPMPVMMVNGTSDTLTQYQYVAQSVNFWKGKNGCTTMATTYQNGVATCVTHGGCTAGADVVLCTIQNGGHQWPGGDTLPFLGNNTTDIIATDALWDFFVAHPRT